MTYALDAAIRLKPKNETTFLVMTDERFWNGDSAFGGWQAAVLGAAVKQQQPNRSQLVSQQVMFQAPVRGEHFEVRVELLEQRRTLDFWHASLVDPEVGRIMASCQIVMGDRQPTSLGFETQPETFRDFDASFPLPAQPGTPTWFQHYDIRLAKGRPFQKNSAPFSATWVKERDGRPLDDIALLSIADTPMPRTFFCADGRVPASTIALGTHIYGTEEQIRGANDTPVLLDTRSQVVRDGLVNQENRLFREDGLLLAISYQTALFRERTPES
ncbi:MAG: thioesterase family protein [Pseudomonadota bacterium]